MRAVDRAARKKHLKMVKGLDLIVRRAAQRMLSNRFLAAGMVLT